MTIVVDQFSVLRCSVTNKTIRVAAIPRRQVRRADKFADNVNKTRRAIAFHKKNGINQDLARMDVVSFVSVSLPAEYVSK